MYPKSFKKLIDYFASLPSVGPKMAERLVLYLFKQDKIALADFGETLAKLKVNLCLCERCANISEDNLCIICLDKAATRKKFAWWKNRWISWPWKELRNIPAFIMFWAGRFPA